MAKSVHSNHKLCFVNVKKNSHESGTNLEGRYFLMNASEALANSKTGTEIREFENGWNRRPLRMKAPSTPKS